MTQYLYRNSGRRAIALLLMFWLLAAFGAAQIRDRTQHTTQPSDNNQSQINAKTTKRGPRAIAVLEFLPGGGARLVPVALWIDDRFYDASLYGANPEPMALQPGTVYEATDYGESTGLFTVTRPEEVKGNWVGDGHWKPHLALDEKIAQQAAKHPKPVTASNPLDDRPTLHRAGSSGSSNAGSSGDSGGSGSGPSSAGSSSASASTTSSTPEPPDRPTLKKPSPDTATASSASAPQVPPANTASATSTSASSPDESDPNRPVLRRGKPATQAATAEPSAAIAPPATAVTAATQATPTKLVTTTASLGRRSYPAVSDATPHETRSLLYAMNSAERAEKAEQMRSLAMDEIRKFVAKRNTPGLPKNATITDYDLRAYDLEYSNSPTLVFTATLPVQTAKALRGGEFNYFVTVVAHEDINGAPIKIFSSVSDSNHLDAFPRMEIIDAVDADANGRGDLLFRQYSDVAINYSLYRVYPYAMQKVFEGGSGM